MKEYTAKLIYGEKMILGEGPFWDVERQTLSWVDIITGTVYLKRADEVAPVQTGQYVGAAVPAGGGEYLLALTTGFYLMDEKGLKQKLASPENMPLRYRFNDAKCDKKGRLWAGTIGLYGDENRQGALYCMEGGRARTMMSGLSLPNGMDWDDEKRLFYFIDTPGGKVTAYHYDMEKAGIAFSHTAAIIREGVPDGMTIDSEGKIWVAQWGGGCVCRYDPQNGEVLAKISIPAANVTSCCFGGRNLDTLYITTASKAGEPESGYLFAAEPGIQGLPVNYYVK